MSNTSSYCHCKNVLSSVKYIHTATGRRFPADNFGLEATLQGLKRRLKGTPQFVLPIDPVILRRMYINIDITNTQDPSVWCSFLTAFYSLFCKANTVPKDYDFDPDCVLTRGDINIDEAGQNVLIYVNFSKVNQYQKSFHVIPIPANSDPALDLYRHISKLFSCVRASRTSPAFMYSARHFITYRSFTHRLKQLLAKSGLDPALCIGYSFRRGGASYLYGIGGSTLMVQVLGDWASQSFTRYPYPFVDDRKAAQKPIRININSTTVFLAVLGFWLLIYCALNKKCVPRTWTSLLLEIGQLGHGVWTGLLMSLASLLECLRSLLLEPKIITTQSQVSSVEKNYLDLT